MNSKSYFFNILQTFVQEAEIICHVSKAETISYAESVLLGDPFDFLADWTTSTKRGYCRMSASCYSAFPAIRNFAQKLTGATGILLFYSYLDEKQVLKELLSSCLDQWFSNFFDSRTT